MFFSYRCNKIYEPYLEHSRILAFPRLANWLVYVGIDFLGVVRCFLCHWVSHVGRWYGRVMRDAASTAREPPRSSQQFTRQGRDRESEALSLSPSIFSLSLTLPRSTLSVSP